MRINNTKEDELFRLMPPNPDSGRLTVVCSASDYSASIIARAVEDANANLLNLNVTSETEGPRIVVDLRVSTRNVASVARSLMRHGYDVVAEYGADEFDDEQENPYAALIHYLEI